MQARPALGVYLVMLLSQNLGATELPAPDQPGPYSIGHISVTYTDASRNGRAIPTDIWYPTNDMDGVATRYAFPYSKQDTWAIEPLYIPPIEAANVFEAGPFPLAIISHGNGANVLRLTYLGEALASHGFVVAAPGHTGNQWHDWRFGGQFLDVQTMDRYRPMDVSRVIDEITRQNADRNDPLFGRVDLDRIGVAGHSYGGYTALAMATGIGDVPSDPRVKAIVPIDPTRHDLTSKSLGMVDVPTLLIGRPRTRGMEVPTAHNDTVDRLLDFVPRKYRVDIPTAGHSSFAYMECQFLRAIDPASAPKELIDILHNGIFPDTGPHVGPCGPDVLSIDEVQRLTRHYTTSFFKLHLSEDRRYEPFLSQRLETADSIEIQTRSTGRRQPVQLLIEDPQGRQLGFDPVSVEFVNDFGDDARFSAIGPDRHSYHLPMDEILTGDYVISGLAIEDGPYSITTSVVHSGESLLLRSDTEVAAGFVTAPVSIPSFTLVLRDESESPRLRPGDADRDFDFDQLDLLQVQVAGKYLSGLVATWGEGDWNGAPGGDADDPPSGNGFFDQLDVIAALEARTYLTGPYTAIEASTQFGEGKTSLVYHANTGEVTVEAPAGVDLTSINIDSAAGIFTGSPAHNLGGSFDNDADSNIFKATFGGGFGSVSFGRVAQSGLSEKFLLGDLSVLGSLAGGGALSDVELMYVPEPTTRLLFLVGLAIGLLRFKRLSG